MESNPLATLYKLQQCERDISAINRERKEAMEVKVLAEVKERLEKFQKLLATLNRRLKTAEKTMRAAELELGTTEESKQSVEQRLYGGEVSSPKELGQLETRLDGLKQELSAAETEFLGAMERVEEIQAQVAKVKAGLAKTETQVKAAEDRVAHKESEWDLKSDMLVAEVEDLRSVTEPSLLQLYDRKKVTTRGEPVAYVQRGVCGGCRMELPAALRSQRGKGMPVCEQCGRLLYWPE